MTHEDAGHYAAKHPAGTEANPVIAEEIQKYAYDSMISCAAAHRIARDLGVDPAEVGKAIDLLEHKISRCQMGLFGYSPEKRIIKPADCVDPELERAIRSGVVNSRVSCAKCWEIAAALGCSKMAVAAVCEALEIKISPCQLGAFGKKAS